MERWERQPYESRQAYEAFQMYRDAGATRSVHKVAQALSKSQTLLKRWSSRWEWVNRADGYDREIDRGFRAETHQARMDMARRHQRIAQAAMGKIVERLQTLDPASLTNTELIRWLGVCCDIERNAVGGFQEDATENDVAHAGALVTELVSTLRRTG